SLVDALFFRSHADTTIINSNFMKYLKSKKVVGWEEIDKVYELNKRTIPLYQIKNGQKIITLVEKINLRTEHHPNITYDFRLKPKFNYPKPLINFKDNNLFYKNRSQGSRQK